MTDARRKVLWFGEGPSAPQVMEMENRGLTIHHSAIDRPLGEAPLARAAVVQLAPTEDALLLDMVIANARQLIDHGLRVDLVAENDAVTGRAQARLGPEASRAGIKLHTGVPPHVLAEAIARHDAGPSPRPDLEIRIPGDREDLRPADRVLFQRAFAQCSAITLIELGGGRSDARVFAVHLIVDRSNIGAWPQPAFAKIDRRDKIEREYGNYRGCGERFIPCGLRPNIETMVAGSERSLLVGNFVDRSESLWDLVRRNVGGPAITALLEETLGGLRDQGYAQDEAQGSVAVAMRDAGLWDPMGIDPFYVERAAGGGAANTPEHMWSVLSALDQRYRVAPIHGDLHGENVRVRGSSAILIDLASVTRGPLTADLAALETWLAFELPPSGEADDKRFFDAPWASVIERLYAPSTFRHPPGPARPATPLAWMEAVVRQIRTMGIAIQSCPTEYQSAVAVQLLRRCQWASGSPGDRGRRAFGYNVAAGLVADLQEAGS